MTQIVTSGSMRRQGKPIHGTSSEAPGNRKSRATDRMLLPTRRLCLTLHVETQSRCSPVKMTSHFGVGGWGRGGELSGAHECVTTDSPCPAGAAAEEEGMVTPQPAVEVEVWGQRFVLRSEKSAEEVRQIAAYVDHRLRQVAEQGRTGLLRLAIMAALTVADDYHSATGSLDVPRSG